MSAPEPIIDAALVRRLIAAQFPEWTSLPVTPVAVSGWDNRTFHLGNELSVRLPAAAPYAAAIEKEHHWLPRLAPGLPVAIPQPLALGQPSEHYPWHWSVRRWLPGSVPDREVLEKPMQLARDLAQFLQALQAVPTDGGPPAGPHSFLRGIHPRCYDKQFQAALAACPDDIDREVAQAIWQRAMATEWQGPGVWVHGDVALGNLLLDRGRLAAVIDFGLLAVGDPACDLVIAWTFFNERERDCFRAELGLGDGDWYRGQAWALWKALLLHSGLGQSSAHEMAAAGQVLSVLDGLAIGGWQ